HRLPFDDQMVKHKVFRPRSDPCRHYIRRGLQKAPWSRELRAEEHRAVQLDAAQYLGEYVHSAPWTICKVPGAPGKRIRLCKPSGQVMATLGHGCPRRLIAQL